MARVAPENQSDSLSIPWSDTVRFVRQLSHDLRNYLNAIELQSTYINELNDDAELKREINRLREMIAGMTSALQKLSESLREPKPDLISYRAADFIEDLRKKIGHDFPEESTEVSWKVETGDSVLNIDPQLLEQVIIELFANAFQHDRGKGSLVAMATVDKSRFVFTLHEPKTGFDLSTENWGRAPLRKISQSHYGLGLNRVRLIMETHGGEMHAQYDPKASKLVTTLSLPLSREKS